MQFFKTEVVNAELWWCTLFFFRGVLSPLLLQVGFNFQQWLFEKPQSSCLFLALVGSDNEPHYCRFTPCVIYADGTIDANTRCDDGQKWKEDEFARAANGISQSIDEYHDCWSENISKVQTTALDLEQLVMERCCHYLY